MQFGLAFSYPFQDKEWIKKVGIAALVSIIPIAGQIIVLGWGLEITRRVIRKDPVPLPDWSDFGGHVVRGIQGFVIGLVYALPLILLVICQNVLTFGVRAISSSSNGSAAFSAMTGAVSVCFGCVTFLYSLAMTLVLPAAFGSFAASDQIGTAFRFSEVFGLVRSVPSVFLLTLLGTIVAGVIGGLGVIVCVIGVFVTYAYALAVDGHLWGQAYTQAAAARGAPPAA
ncbi:MAG: DUF4013 domain-containing protein [Anaerolineales bacterium]|jgi:hypothetical protein